MKVEIVHWTQNKGRISPFQSLTSEVLSGVGGINSCRLFAYNDFDGPRLPEPTPGTLNVLFWRSSDFEEVRGDGYRLVGGGYGPSVSPLCIFGRGVPSMNYFRPAPRPKGEMIVDDDGYMVAELVERSNLFIHAPIPHNNYDPSDALFIYQRILEEVKKMLVVDVREVIAAALSRSTNSTELLEGYRTLAIETLVSETGKLRGNKQSLNERLLLQEKQVQDMAASITGTNRELRLLGGGESSWQEQAERLHQELRALPQVRRVVVDDVGTIKIYTDNITVFSNRSKRRHDIGHFRVEFRLRGDDGYSTYPYWFNLDRNVDGYQAPHVNNQGKACLGNTEDSFSELFNNGEVTLAAMLAIQFVNDVNEDDNWGRNIVNWPEVKSLENTQS